MRSQVPPMSRWYLERSKSDHCLGACYYEKPILFCVINAKSTKTQAIETSMSVQIKSLTVGAPVVDSSLASPNDNFNLIPAANTVYDLYAAAKSATDTKAAIVNSLRLVNTHTAAVVV